MPKAFEPRDDLSAHWDDIGDIGTANSTAAPDAQWPSEPQQSQYASAEAYELTPEGRLRDSELLNPSSPGARYTLASGISDATKYEDGDTIDWLAEEAIENRRRKRMRARPGWRGALFPTADATRMWLVLILTGLFIGVVGAWMDVLVKWLGDLREGRCSYGIFYNQASCCTGIDAGDICTDWQTWSRYFHIKSIILQSLLQSTVYISLGVLFAGTASTLVVSYAPYAFHTGIPEVIAILGGYVLDGFLTPWTLLIKALGVVLAVASGLSLGKEGPLVHIACCAAHLLCSLVPEVRANEARKRKLLAAAAAAGVSVAFGSPIGGVLFGLEELATFADETDTLWRAFVTSAIAAVALSYVDPFGTSRLVLFQVKASDSAWRAFELVPWAALGIIGGLLGALLIKLNVKAAVYRRQNLAEWPVLEVVGAAAVTAALSYLVVFLRVPSSELVAMLFQECNLSQGDYHGLCNPTALWRNVFLLLFTAACKVALTAWTFGMMIPAGVFLPSIAIGACIGRAMGLVVQGMYRAYPTLPIFAACPPDPLVPCISPGFYAVVGAAAMLGGVTRMTISLVVIMFELTGALSHVLPIMISVMLSKWVGDAFGTEGIYASWIALRGYPWIPHGEHLDAGETAGSKMREVGECVCLTEGGHDVKEVEGMLVRYRFEGFPVIKGKGELVGYVERRKLKAVIEHHMSFNPTEGARRCFFVKRNVMPADSIDLSHVLDRHVLALRTQVPLELVVSTFQKMNVRHLFFTENGRLQGMMSKTDIAALLAKDVPFVGMLANTTRSKEAYVS